MHWRIRFSRWLGRMLFGRDEMLSSLADQRQWRLRLAINALFLDSQHCSRAADWEAGLMRSDDTQDPLSCSDGRFVNDNRRAGRL
jgi:hypothetical protein